MVTIDTLVEVAPTDEVELPVRNWTERRYCGECDESTTYLCAEWTDGYADGVCAFCGNADDIFTPERDED